MPPRFDHGDIRHLLKHFGFQRLGQTSFIYIGQTFGVNRTVKFDYHSDRTQLKTGTARQIAKSLGFKDQQAMKDYINNDL
jgi:hypothetical protein